MDIRELKYFVQIVLDGSYSSAAETLYISQPALSRTIQKMESELGFRLFYTAQRVQKLTPRGRTVYEKALRVIHEYDNIPELVKTPSNPPSGSLSIGFPPIVGTCYFCEILAEYSRLYPEIEVHIQEAGTDRLLTDIRSGLLDLGCVCVPVPEESFHWIPFASDAFCLAVSRTHPLANKEFVSFLDLKDEAFVLSGTDFSIRQFYYFCRQAGFKPNVVMTVSRWDFAIQMVRLNYGISFQPEALFKRFEFSGIKLLRTDYRSDRQAIGLAIRKENYIPHNVSQFIDFALCWTRENPDADTGLPLIRQVY